jgi:hypothetical protein
MVNPAQPDFYKAVDKNNLIASSNNLHSLTGAVLILSNSATAENSGAILGLTIKKLKDFGLSATERANYLESVSNELAHSPYLEDTFIKAAVNVTARKENWDKQSNQRLDTLRRNLALS